ncbi:hypothetical protein D3C76_1653490 [compost metagenome]
MRQVEPAFGKGNEHNAEREKGAEYDADRRITFDIAAAGYELNQYGGQQAEE